jgi:hypothetical protein
MPVDPQPAMWTGWPIAFLYPTRVFDALRGPCASRPEPIPCFSVWPSRRWCPKAPCSTGRSGQSHAERLTLTIGVAKLPCRRVHRGSPPNTDPYGPCLVVGERAQSQAGGGPTSGGSGSGRHCLRWGAICASVVRIRQSADAGIGPSGRRRPGRREVAGGSRHTRDRGHCPPSALTVACRRLSSLHWGNHCADPVQLS